MIPLAPTLAKDGRGRTPRPRFSFGLRIAPGSSASSAQRYQRRKGAAPPLRHRPRRRVGMISGPGREAEPMPTGPTALSTRKRGGLPAHEIEHVGSASCRRSGSVPRQIAELDAVVGQDRMDLVRHGFDEGLNQKAIDLEKRKMAYAKGISTCLISQISRPRQMKFIGAAILDQNRFHGWQRLAQRGCDRFGRIGEAFGRKIQKKLFVAGIGEGFDLIDPRQDFALQD